MPPMSEMLMFSSKKVPKHTVLIDTTYTYQSKFSIGVSAQGYLFSTQHLDEYFRERNQQYEGGNEGAHVAMTLSSILMSDKIDWIAVNLAMFPAIGADLTLNPYKDYFATYGYTTSGGKQLILQKRLVYNARYGASAGLFYESKENYYSNCSAYWGICREPNTDIIGVRGLFMIHDGLKNRTSLNLNAKIGYIFDYQTPYVNAGISMALF